jgi:hypothetical protein
LFVVIVISVLGAEFSLRTTEVDVIIIVTDEEEEFLVFLCCWGVDNVDASLSPVLPWVVVGVVVVVSGGGGGGAFRLLLLPHTTAAIATLFEFVSSSLPPQDNCR